MDSTIYNPHLEWYKMPEDIEYIKILQDQGVSTFDPVKFYNEAKYEIKEEVDLSTLSRKERKQIKKSKISKKALKMVQDNIKKKEENLREEEDRKLNHFITKCVTIDDMAQLVDKMKTTYGRINSKIELLDKCIIDNFDVASHLLFFSLNEETEYDDLKSKKKQILLKYKGIYSSQDLIQIQMTKLSSYLNPLNPFQNNKRKLDDWQVDVFERIEKKQNILIVAPTSAGKTVCSTYCAVIGNKTLFVVPSDELARQVAGIFRNMPNIMVGIITNKEYYMDNDVSVIIGTPKRLEEFIVENRYYYDKEQQKREYPDEENLIFDSKYLRLSSNYNFDYVIYDEIQMLNSDEGAAFENLIKLLDVPSLFLSATIDDPNRLKEWLELVKNKEVNLVTYNKRFIVQQRYLWQENQLKHLHPLSCINNQFLLDDGFNSSDISFTPRDTYHLYNIIKEKNPNCNEIKPNTLLKKDKWDSLSLNDTIVVEKAIKTFLTNLARTSPDVTKEILDSYSVSQKTESNIDIIKLIKHLIDKDMCPAIFFKLDAFKCRTIFKYIVKELERQQNEKYPHHYDDLATQYDALRNFNNDWNDQKEKISIPKDLDPDIFKENLRKKLSDKHLDNLKKKFTQIIQIRIEKLIASDMDKETIKFYIAYYNQERDKILEMDDLPEVDKNMPHPEFTFNYMGVDSNMMRGIRRELKQGLGTDVKWTHPILIGIERGIVPYFKDMEVPFQRIVQSLFAQKKIPIIISDESLGYGINMPIRTVVILGKENQNEIIDPLKANQMSGRSGRRGIDREGHIVYVGVDWKSILRGSFPELTGVNPISVALPLPLYFNKLKVNDINRIFTKTLFQFKNNIENDNKGMISNLISNNINFTNEITSKIMWSCRYLDNNYKQIPIFLNEILAISNLDHYKTFEYITCLFDGKYPYNGNFENTNLDTSTLYDPTELITVYKEKRILDNDDSQDILNRLKNIGYALAALHITTNQTLRYRSLTKHFKDVFNNIKNITIKYQF